jgi:hypothetical protein
VDKIDSHIKIQGSIRDYLPKWSYVIGIVMEEEVQTSSFLLCTQHGALISS